MDLNLIDSFQLVGDAEKTVERIAAGCGSAGQFLETARRAGCDAFVTGETSFHTCLEAEATDIALLLVGHFASERFAVEKLAEQIQFEFPYLQVWASQLEQDTLRVL